MKEWQILQTLSRRFKLVLIIMAKQLITEEEMMEDGVEMEEEMGVEEMEVKEMEVEEMGVEEMEVVEVVVVEIEFARIYIYNSLSTNYYYN